MCEVLDLKGLSNHKNIGLKDNKNCGINSFFVLEDKLNCESFDIDRSGIKLKLLGAYNNFDNIICQSQIIKLKRENVLKKIFIMGFSEFNTSTDFISIKTSKRMFKKEFGFYSIFSADPELNDYNNIVNNFIIQTVKYKSNTGGYLCYYIGSLDLSNNKEKTISLTLPDNFDIHICSISLQY